jgi:hypothetical protein
LIRPVSDEEKLAHIEKIDYEDPCVKPEFKKDMNILTKKLMSRAQKKIINGKPITGSMFLGLSMGKCTY